MQHDIQTTTSVIIRMILIQVTDPTIKIYFEFYVVIVKFKAQEKDEFSRHFLKLWNFINLKITQ